MKSLLFQVVGLLLTASSVHALPFRFLAWDDEVAARKLAVAGSLSMDRRCLTEVEFVGGPENLGAIIRYNDCGCRKSGFWA